MVAAVSPEALRGYPPELVRFVTDEAGRDADDVAALLAEAGLAPPPGGTRSLPPGVLLDLGAVVRLRRWEAAGHAVHTEAGLPTARGLLHLVVGALRGAAVDPAALSDAGSFALFVFDLAVRRFAWAARPELGADVLLDVEDEDSLVEAVAQFLWARRHDGPANG